MNIEPKIAAFAHELTAIRRDIHAHPELGFEEERTSTIVAQKLKEWGLEVTTGTGINGRSAFASGLIRPSGEGTAMTMRSTPATRAGTAFISTELG